MRERERKKEGKRETERVRGGKEVHTGLPLFTLGESETKIRAVYGKTEANKMSIASLFVFTPSFPFTLSFLSSVFF